MTRPNVLLVVCDQLARHVLGTYGGPVPTPNLDRIADGGTTLTDATCPTPVCSPSRAAMATGRYPHANGIRSNVGRSDVPAQTSPPTQEGLKREDDTIGSLFADAGYDTHHYGKFHLSDDYLPYYDDMYRPHKEYAQEMAADFRAVRRSGERFLDWKGWALPVEVSPAYEDALADADWEFPDWPPSRFLETPGRLRMDPGDTFDVRVADNAVERIETSADRGAPFLVTASFNWPHDPNVVPEPYYSQFDPDAIDLPENRGARAPRFEDEPSRQIVTRLGERGLRELLRVYYGCVSLLDDQVGRLLDALDRTGQREHTLVVFTADHGDMVGGHGMFWKGTTAFYEEVSGVPLLVDGPSVVDRAPDDQPASLVDLLPTLLDFAGVEAPDDVQGSTLGPYLWGEVDGAELPAYSFGERVHSNEVATRTVYERPLPGSFMVRGRRFKYTIHDDGEEFLYDRETDLGETRDVLEEHPEVRTEMRAALREWLADTDYPGDPLTASS